MKELGEELRALRKKNGVSREEASNDLGITSKELECLENGNFKVFKDVYELKKVILNYAKYLGLDEERILDEFNDYLFEKTSKISKEEIAELKKEEEEPDKISSPYTKLGKTRHDIAPVVLLVVLLVFISLVVYLLLSIFKKDENDNIVALLEGREVLVYELTK